MISHRRVATELLQIAVQIPTLELDSATLIVEMARLCSLVLINLRPTRVDLIQIMSGRPLTGFQNAWPRVNTCLIYLRAFTPHGLDSLVHDTKLIFGRFECFQANLAIKMLIEEIIQHNLSLSIGDNVTSFTPV